jgi:hypothetical protein
MLQEWRQWRAAQGSGRKARVCVATVVGGRWLARVGIRKKSTEGSVSYQIPVTHSSFVLKVLLRGVYPRTEGRTEETTGGR